MSAPALRVLCVSNMYPGTGDPDYGSFVAQMCRALERQRCLVDLAVIDTRGRGPLRTPAKYARLLERTAARARGADVIYAHYIFPTGTIAALCGRLSGRPWVVTAHGRDVRNLADPRLRRLSQSAVSGASCVIAVSRYLAGELSGSGLRLPSVEVANMGVDVAQFGLGDREAARRRLRLEPDGPLVLSVGGLTRRKNPLGLLQALVRVRQVHPGARLALVGDGPLRDAVTAGISRLGLAGSVVRTGSLPHERIADWMAACNLLALPSLVEPLGVVALEALASGRPVVATRVGGTGEVLGSAGALVDPTDPSGIARGILEVLDGPPSPQACRAAAEVHSIDRQAARVAAILAAARDQGEGSRRGRC